MCIRDSLNNGVSDTQRCNIQRELARGYAKTGELDLAVVSIDDSFRLAGSLEEVGALGNAYFGKAEVLRAQNDHVQSLKNYSLAIELAKGVNNRDLLLWSFLGQGFSQFALGENDILDETILKIRNLTSEKNFLHPIETLHLELLILLSGRESEISKHELLSKYLDLGLVWPEHYTELSHDILKECYIPI